MRNNFSSLPGYGGADSPWRTYSLSQPPAQQDNGNSAAMLALIQSLQSQLKQQGDAFTALMAEFQKYKTTGTNTGTGGSGGQQAQQNGQQIFNQNAQNPSQQAAYKQATYTSPGPAGGYTQQPQGAQLQNIQINGQTYPVSLSDWAVKNQVTLPGAPPPPVTAPPTTAAPTPKERDY